MLAREQSSKRRYRTLRLASDKPLNAYAGMRAADEAPCLVVEMNDTTEHVASNFEVGGMRLSYARAEPNRLLVLSLEDPTRLDLFTTICADVVDVSDEAADQLDALRSFLTRLDAWRIFLREHQTGLGRGEVVGLMGELKVLAALLRLDAECLSTWRSPSDGLHDFERGGHSLEVKTTLGSANQLGISNLDQLDTAGVRRLDLIHVRLAELQNGPNLGELIGEILTILPSASARQEFENALLRRGLMPDDSAARTSPRVELQAMTAFTVGPSFPRILHSDVPLGVVDAQYTVDLQALRPFACDLGGAFESFAGGGI